MTGATIWADAMRALTLFAADPARLGGIAVRAGAGPVRDLFIRRLLDMLPPGTPMRRLPLHAADDRLLGGLDLTATLGAGRPILQRGLLAEVDGGIVLLPMAERIEPGLAARLQAVLDDGVVALQRDGLACVMPARFGLVALDEGVEPDERPPASLLDRLAFHVDLTTVSLRDVASAGDHPDSLYPETAPCEEPLPDAAATLCHAGMAMGISSSRASLLALRAAYVAAHLAGREQISEDDLGLAARLVLAPRATCLPPGEEQQPAPETDPPASQQDPPADGAPDQSMPADTEDVPDQKVADRVLDAAKAALPPDLLARLAHGEGGRGDVRVAGRAGQFKASGKRGRPVGTRQGEPSGGNRLHLLETLKAAAPWQALRKRPAHPDRFEVRREDFRIVRFRQRIGTTTVFAVDASGSAALNRLSEAKGAVELLLADCYVRRDQVALLAFRGTGATLLLAPTGSLLRAKRSLAGLPGGGPTPLAAGIEAALLLAGNIRRTGRTPVITLLTDGRANIGRNGSGGRPLAEAEALDSARMVGASGIATLLLDTSPRPNPFARRLADQMRARYLPLPYADASAVSRAVRSAAAA